VIRLHFIGLAWMVAVLASSAGIASGQIQPHSVDAVATPFAGASDYRALGWNPAALSFGGFHPDITRAVGSVEVGAELSSPIFARKDVWNDILDRPETEQTWSNLSSDEWIERLADNSIRLEAYAAPVGSFRRGEKWALAYAMRKSFQADAFLGTSTAELLISGGAAPWFEFVITTAGDTLVNSFANGDLQLEDIVGGIDVDGDATLAAILEDTNLGFTYTTSHEIGISRKWGDAEGWQLHTGIGGRLLLGNGYFQMRAEGGQVEAFGAFSKGFSIAPMNALSGTSTAWESARNWGPVGQGWGMDLGVLLAHPSGAFVATSVTRLGWMEWRGERYEAPDISTGSWQQNALEPGEWMEAISLAMNPETWFEDAESETRRISHGAQWNIGGGLQLGKDVRWTMDMTLDPGDRIGDDRARWGTSILLRLLPSLRFSAGIEAHKNRGVSFPASVVFTGAGLGWEGGLTANDMQVLWNGSQSSLGMQGCFIRWVW
jgi:hypothetical protein